MNITFEDIFKIFLIIFLSGLLGYNREKLGMLVGVRTHILVGLSAVILQITALKFSMNEFYTSGDPSRFGGQMLSGIGFLGAGSIIKENKSIKGLTTAASIFFVACVGLTVGFGYYILAIIVTVLGYLLLSDALKLKKHIKNKNLKPLNLLICYKDNSNINVKDIVSILSTMDLDVLSLDLKKDKNDINITLKIKADDSINPTDIISEISQLNNLTKIQQI